MDDSRNEPLADRSPAPGNAGHHRSSVVHLAGYWFIAAMSHELGKKPIAVAAIWRDKVSRLSQR